MNEEEYKEKRKKEAIRNLKSSALEILAGSVMTGAGIAMMSVLAITNPDPDNVPKIIYGVIPTIMTFGGSLLGKAHTDYLRVRGYLDK